MNEERVLGSSLSSPRLPSADMKLRLEPRATLREYATLLRNTMFLKDFSNFQCPAGASVVPSVRRRIDQAAVALCENGITALIDTRDAAMTPRQAMRRGFRRHILAPIAEAAQEFSTRQLEHIESGALLSGIPERQKHVLDHRGRLPGSSSSWLLPKTSGCDDCRHCVGVCPTGALSRQRKDGQRIFGVATERCAGCHACLDSVRRTASPCLERRLLAMERRRCVVREHIPRTH